LRFHIPSYWRSPEESGKESTAGRDAAAGSGRGSMQQALIEKAAKERCVWKTSRGKRKTGGEREEIGYVVRH